MRPCLFAVLACWLATAPLVARAAGNDQPSPEHKRAAQKTFEAADGLYEAGRYAEAATVFRASHEFVASPNSRLMLARSLREAGQLAEAYREFVGTVADVDASRGRYAETGLAARAEGDALKPRLAFITVPSEQVRSVQVGSTVFTNQQLQSPIPVDPGKLTVTLTRPDNSVVTRELTLATGATEALTLEASLPEASATVAPESPPVRSEPAREPVRSNPLRTWAYVAGGAGVAGFAGFGLFGLMNRSTHSSLETDCASAVCPAGSSANVDRGRTYQTLANVGLVVGVVGAATGVTLFVLSRPKAEPAVAAIISPGYVSVRGSF